MFTAVGMALRTVAAVVAIFFLMLVVHFLLRMTVSTGPARRIAARMAGSAVVVCSAMSRRKRVVKRCARERVRIVTI